MAFTNRQHSKGQIDRAGAVLVNWINEETLGANTLDLALTVVNNWRACHSYPLQIIKMTLLKRAKSVDSATLVAQRLNRRYRAFLFSVDNRLRPRESWRTVVRVLLNHLRSLFGTFAQPV